MPAAAERTEVTAEWARIGKSPGSADDYGILAASQGILDVRVLSEFATSYVAGIPDPQLDPASPGAPPWVTFGTHGSAERRFVSVDVQLPWDGLRDQTGRPTWSRNFFVLPYDGVTEHGLSYQTLYAAVRDVELPLTDGPPLQLRPAPQPVADLIPAIERFGLECLAAIAAALLDAPVAVGGVEGLRVGRRLRLLDAVAALLPRYFRADLSASSAVSGLNVPRMRLILTNVAVDNRQQAHLTEGLSSALSAGARHYRGQLLRVAERRGLPELVDQLWAARSDPAPAATSVIAALTTLSEISAAADESKLRERAGEPGSIDRPFTHEYFARPAEVLAREWEHLPKASRDAFLRLLVAADDEETPAALARTWPIVVRDLIALVNDDLDQGGTELAARGFTAAVRIDPPKVADQYLEYILVSGVRKELPDGWPELIRPRVDLLCEFRSPPVRTAYPETRKRLRYGRDSGWQARLVRTLLADELAERARAYGWARWITGPAPEAGETPEPNWVTALDFVVVGRGEPGAAGTAMSEVVRAEPQWALILFRLAESSGRLPDTLAALRAGHGLPEAVAALIEERSAAAARAVEELAAEESDQERRDGVPRS